MNTAAKPAAAETPSRESVLMLAENWGWIARCEAAFSRTYRTAQARNRHARKARLAARQAAHYALRFLDSEKG